jgi:hypothetical protein
VTRGATIHYEWPAELRAILPSGKLCPDPIFVEVLVGADFASGDPEAASISIQPTGCRP